MRSEFQFIRNVERKYGLRRLGDDCAVLPKDSNSDLVITVDMLVEDVDFRLDWATPDALGHKALSVSLSDIAAMGGTPKWSMLSIGIPEKVWNGKFVDKFYSGWFKLAGDHKVELIGGDVSRTPDKVVIDSIVGGEVRRGKAVMRSGAKPGDSIFVTGSLGGAAGGLSVLESQSGRPINGIKKRRLVNRLLRPIPRIEIGRYLSRFGIATSMIDVSDGLAADLYHLCEASSVGALIELDKIPVDPNLAAIEKENIAFALGGGEDFELLFTSRKKIISHGKFADLSRIGEVTSNAGIVEVVENNSTRELPRTGFQHF
jgi:thiamine-monophosphate kinase